MKNILQKARRWSLLGLVAIALWLFLSVGAYFLWVHGADHRDFYPRWAGARLALFEGKDLYSESTTQQMQITLYGAPLPSDRDQQGFAYPAILVVELLPFWLIENVEIATAAWEGFSVLLILIGLLLARSITGKAPVWGLFVFIAWYYPMLMIFQGQVTAIPLLAAAAGIWLLFKRRSFWAGVILSLGWVKPEIILLPVLTILITTLAKKRWRFSAGLAVGTAVLLASSVLVAGWWIPGWIEALQRYAGYAKVVWPIIDSWRLHPFLGMLVTAGIIFLLYWMRKTQYTFLAASIPLGLLLLPQTLIWGLTMVLLPITLCWYGKARWLIYALWGIGWVFLVWSPGAEGWKVQSAIIPLVALCIVSLASRTADSESELTANLG